MIILLGSKNKSKRLSLELALDTLKKKIMKYYLLMCHQELVVNL